MPIVAGAHCQLVEQARSSSTSGLPVVSSLSPVENRIGAGQETQQACTASPISRRPADMRTRAFGMVIRATATVRHEFQRIERGGAIQGRAFDLHQVIDRLPIPDKDQIGQLRDHGGAAGGAIRPCRTMPPHQTLMPASRTLLSVSRRFS